ncbi:MAG: hypothetical protein WAW62_01745 [Candidatus Saccharimonas aalborgensis]
MYERYQPHFENESHKDFEYDESGAEVDLRQEAEVFLDHERVDNGRDSDIKTQLVKLRESLSEDSDGIIHLTIPAYSYDFSENPFVGLGRDRTKTYEISRYIDVVFLHRFMYQDIIVCGLQSRQFVDEGSRASFVKKMRETGGIPIDTREHRSFDILGMEFCPYVEYHSTDAFFKLYHTVMPRVADRPHYPLDVWLIFDANAYQEVEGASDFRRAFCLKSGYDRRASLLDIAQIN